MKCDVVDRKTAIKRVTDILKEMGAFDIESTKPKGTWLDCGRYASRCDKCKRIVYWDKEFFEEYEFCPRCGADMQGGK